jgi:thiol-disulfide isomerase/thioredoxin
MSFLHRSIVALSFAVLTALPSVSAAEKKAKFSDWDLGKVVFGERIARKDVKGKVVVLEYWGVKCPPCIASLPHLAEMDRKHRDDGLVIIGAECQMHSKDEMKPVLEKAKVDYTIVEGAEGPIEVTALPRIFVFGTDGQLVFDGRPSDPAFDKAVEDALAPLKSGNSEAAAEANLIEQREWTNASGGKIKAAVKSADDKKVTFLMPNGKTVDYPLEKLSDESREAIAEALEAAGEDE